MGAAHREQDLRIGKLVRCAAAVAEFLRWAANLALALVERVFFPWAPRTDAVRRVGVLRIGMIGDLVAALPALEAIRASHVGAELVLFTSPGPAAAPGAAELLEGSPAVDRIVRWTTEDLVRAGRSHVVAMLRTHRCDRVYVLPQDRTTPRLELRNLIALKLAGQRGVRGARLASARFLPRFLAHAHAFVSRPPGEAQRLLTLVQRCGARAEPTDTALAVQRTELASWCAAQLRELAPAGEPLLCLAPGGKLEHKRWPASRFGEVARTWIDAGGVAVVLGGAQDTELAHEVEHAAGTRVPHLCGVGGLLESAALLEHAAALVTNDTGTMHLGAAMGTPIVAVFSGFDRVGAWDPWQRSGGGAQHLLRYTTRCSPCGAASCNARTGGVPHCLDGIWVEQALVALGAVARVLPEAIARVA